MKKTMFSAAAVLATLPVPAHADTIVLAGGCFWGMEGVFEHVKGVTNVTTGYAGGSARDATYDAVSTERTGHAEAIKVTFDPAKISLGELLNVYFVVAHDPTQKNGQYPDEGPSYRSAIFPQTPAQRSFAQAYIAALNAKPAFHGRIATRLETGSFFAAEAYHQDFMRRNPNHPYIQRWDVARVRKLQTTFPSLYRSW